MTGDLSLPALSAVQSDEGVGHLRVTQAVQHTAVLMGNLLTPLFCTSSDQKSDEETGSNF